MKITHYLYNAFVIESGKKKIAIDPGALFFYWFRFTTLIPKLVIPRYYNCPAFFTKTYNPADVSLFKEQVEKAGANAAVLQTGDSIDLAGE